MHVTKLRLQNFRGFQDLELALDPEITVLVGVNGAGKSSVLDALAALLGELPRVILSGELRATPLAQSDIRVGAGSAAATVTAAVDGTEHRWTVGATLPGRAALAPSDVEGLRPAMEAARASIAAGTPDLPLAVYFPTNRSALDIPARIRTAHEFDATSAFDGALEGGASNFRGFFEWFREEEDVLNEQLLLREQGQEASGFPSRLPIVRHAIEELFPGASGLRVERRPQRMTLMLGGRRLDVAQLSDGEKCLLALAGDLARRMVLAAPERVDPLGHPCVVLIDEVELHLHPGLQRTILPRLRHVFPNTQFIVSTHSPQVLSSVRAESVRLIVDFAVHPLEQGTWHRDTNRVLQAAFGDAGRPPEVAEKLAALRDAVDADRHADARALIAQLREMMEGDDPDVFFLEQLLPPEDASVEAP